MSRSAYTDQQWTQLAILFVVLGLAVAIIMQPIAGAVIAVCGVLMLVQVRMSPRRTGSRD